MILLDIAQTVFRTGLKLYSYISPSYVNRFLNQNEIEMGTSDKPYFASGRITFSLVQDSL